MAERLRKPRNRQLKCCFFEPAWERKPRAAKRLRGAEVYLSGDSRPTPA
jgi:hypothetical protein